MSEAPGPPLQTINDVFFRNVNQFQFDPLLAHYREGKLAGLSTVEFRDSVFALAEFLQGAGLEPAARVAVFSENRPQWHIADFAILLSGFVSVPIYATTSGPQLQDLLRRSGSSAIVFSGQSHWEKLRGLWPELPQLKAAVSMDTCRGEVDRVVPLGEIIGNIPSASRIQELCDRATRVQPEAVATIVYTSGTTGEPKGVMLTHDNITFDLNRCVERLLRRKVDQALSVLPLAHAFERLLCYGYFCQGVPIAYADPFDLPDAFGVCRPVVMGCVPRILEKVHEGVRDQITAQPAWKRRLAEGLIRSAKAHPRKGILQDQEPRRRTIVRWLADRLIFARVRERLGGQMSHLVCGGSKLDIEVERFLMAAGLPVVQGYGLTETSPVISLNDPERIRMGTVGSPLRGVEIKLAEDGELLTRGRNVMKGYYQDPQATRQVIRDGWLHTGDLARLDEQGCLILTGRKKEILVTAAGKNVSPQMVEERLKRSPFLREAFAVGDGRKFISALIVPEMGRIEEYARSRDLVYEDESQLLSSPLVQELLAAEIEASQQDLTRHEQVKRFRLVSESILLDPEIMTPTQKVRRGALEKKFFQLIEEIYQ